MARFLFFAFFFLLLGCVSNQPDPETLHVSAIQAELDQMMQASAVAWTADDLDGFMRAFHNSEDLVFAIPTGITRGWQPLKERYAPSIVKSNLWFTDIETTVITAETALVFARFHNVMKEDGSYSTGLTTLLCEKIGGNWVIVHDHSSGLPKGTPRKDP
ncbi:MAG: nuclear transport factor 2 family protein [Planctomycetota bacterium]